MPGSTRPTCGVWSQCDVSVCFNDINYC